MLGYEVVGNGQTMQIRFKGSTIGSVTAKGEVELDSSYASHQTKMNQAHSIGIVQASMRECGIVVKRQEVNQTGGIQMTMGVKGL